MTDRTPSDLTTSYAKPELTKFGAFRELTQWGFASASDGGSIFGISSPGCSTGLGGGRVSIQIGCPNAPTSS